MRRVLLALVSTVTGLVMLLSFKAHTITAVSAAPVVAPSTVSSDSSSDSTSGATSSGSSSSTTSSGSTTSTTTAATKTVTGDSIDTRWGPVQVKITVTGGKITSATAVDYPTSNGRDQEINSYAVPTLEQETVAAGNASIDMVSGATYTSEGYISSLQSALDKV